MQMARQREHFTGGAPEAKWRLLEDRTRFAENGARPAELSCSSGAKKGGPRRILAGALYIGSAALTQLVSGFRTAAPFVGYPDYSQDHLLPTRSPHAGPE